MTIEKLEAEVSLLKRQLDRISTTFLALCRAMFTINLAPNPNLMEIFGDLVVHNTTQMNGQVFVLNTLQHINLRETDAGDYPDKTFIIDINGGIARLMWHDAPSTFTTALTMTQAGLVTVTQGQLDINEQATTDEGGQVTLMGYQANPDWNIDVFQAGLRVHSGGTIYLAVGATTFHVQEQLLVTVSGSDKLRVGNGSPSSTETPLEVLIDNDFQRVSVGAADSAGAGFRYLRVPNNV